MSHHLTPDVAELLDLSPEAVSGQLHRELDTAGVHAAHAAWKAGAARARFGRCDRCGRLRDEEGRPLLVARQRCCWSFECFAGSNARNGKQPA